MSLFFFDFQQQMFNKIQQIWCLSNIFTKVIQTLHGQLFIEKCLSESFHQKLSSATFHRQIFIGIETIRISVRGYESLNKQKGIFWKENITRSILNITYK